MPKFSKSSKDRLATAHPDLQRLFTEVVEYFDCSVICGHRDQAEQDLAYATKKSKLKWPNSKHNKTPSLAVDVVPWPVDWKDTDRFLFFGGFVMGMAKAMGISLRWGGDWDGDNDQKDEKFRDLPHFELTNG